MEWILEHCYWILWGTAAAILLFFYIRQKKRIRTFLLGSSSGLCTLTLLHFLGTHIGFVPTLCFANLLISCTLGVPGILLLYLSELIFT